MRFPRDDKHADLIGKVEQVIVNFRGTSQTAAGTLLHKQRSIDAVAKKDPGTGLVILS